MPISLVNVADVAANAGRPAHEILDKIEAEAAADELRFQPPVWQGQCQLCDERYVVDPNVGDPPQQCEVCHHNYILWS